MAEYQRHYQEDQSYLTEVGMRQLLEQFVKEAVNEKPTDLFEYMALWAQRQQIYAAVADEEEKRRLIERAKKNLENP